MFKHSKSIAYLSLVLFSVGIVPMSYAADFFTIIGPDGRPLVIPRDPTEPRKSTSQKAAESSNNQVEQNIEMPQQREQPLKDHRLESEAPDSTVKSVSTISPKLPNENKSVTPTSIRSKQQPEINTQEKQKGYPQPQPKKLSLETHSIKNEQSSRATEAEQHIVDLNGEKYIDSEYLEDKEFNIEGKKRFYMMPEGIVDARLGAVRMQPEQREKGVSKSFFQSLIKKNQNEKAEEVLALSPTYYRVPKAQVVENLQAACFTDKKIKDAKVFNIEKQIGLWPRKPIKDIFDYTVVKLSAPLKQLKLTSYATTEQNPTFYWPFVVFLDQNGCIIEGVSGYKNQEFPATMLQHAAIEGTIRIPDQTFYLLLTPLASALDVQEKSLSNQGQIKLTAIR